MINIQNLSFSYSKKRPVFDNLNMKLAPGKVYGLLGKNGAGKTTLLKNMSGLLFPHGGHLTVNGFTPMKRLTSFLQTIYYIPEEVYVPAITAKRYVKLFAPFYPRFSEAEFYNYLAQLEVVDEGKLSNLSFGQQKKFIIAFALACNTPVLLMDEPTNGLDIPSKGSFRRLVASVLHDERIIFISTHQVRDLDNLIDGVIVIDEGAVLLNAGVNDIARQLCFKTVREIPEGAEVLYSEAELHGIAVVMKNTANEDTKVNLEQLFNAVTSSNPGTQEIFNNLKPATHE